VRSELPSAALNQARSFSAMSTAGVVQGPLAGSHLTGRRCLFPVRDFADLPRAQDRGSAAALGGREPMDRMSLLGNSAAAAATSSSGPLESAEVPPRDLQAECLPVTDQCCIVGDGDKQWNSGRALTNESLNPACDLARLHLTRRSTPQESPPDPAGRAHTLWRHEPSVPNRARSDGRSPDLAFRNGLGLGPRRH